MKTTFLKSLLLTILFFVAALDLANAQPLTLAQNGKTTYTIALATGAIPAERTAARELSNYLHQITGATFPVRPESQVSPTAPQILVGNGVRAKKALPAYNWKTHKTDGILIKTMGRNLILAGSRPRGSLYAVYSFLEDTLKVRWFTPTVSTVPRQATLKIALQDIDYAPVIKTREVYNQDLQEDALFATRLKINGNNQRQGEALGGHDTILGSVHTFALLLPIATYFKDHPEWYSDPANGGKPCTAASAMPAAWQPCLTNEAARRELTKNALKLLHDNPGAGAISISQNDNKNRCTCEADLALEAKEGSPSGPLLHFVNAVAADIEKAYPDVLVDTLAYQYTQHPPRFVKPRHNVIIRLCSIGADFARPLDSAANAEFRDDLRGWQAISPRLAIWDYVTNFDNYFVPHPNMPVLGPNIKFFAASNASNLFEQGDVNTNGSGDFVAMRTWVMAHLMWKPASDQRQLENDFLRGYYGKAAPYLRFYLDRVQNSFLASDGKEKLSAYQANYSYLTLDTLNAATNDFHQAEAAVHGDAILAARVSTARLALDHAWLLRYNSLRRDAAREGKPFNGPADPSVAAAAFIQALRERKVLRTKETETLEEYAPSFLGRYRPPAPLPGFALGNNENDIIDIQDNLFRLGGVGQWVTLEADPKASDGRAVRLPGNFTEWAVQSPVAEDEAFLKNGPWHCYIMARIQPAPDAMPGVAVNFGVYDAARKVFTLNASRNLADLKIDGEYHPLDLGKIDLNSGMYFWVSGPGRPDIEGVYIDRIILVRESAAEE